MGLDIGRRPAQDLLRQLLARADIFIESTPPGTLSQYRLDYGSVSANTALIYMSLTRLRPLSIRRGGRTHERLFTAVSTRGRPFE